MISCIKTTLTAFLSSLLLSSIPSSATEPLVFVSLSDDQKIATYSLDESNGTLTLLSTTPAGGSAGASCIDPARNRLHVSLKDVGAIATFEITPNGTLTHLQTANMEASPCYLTLHPNGKFLYSAYYRAGQAAVHELDESGNPSLKPHQVLKTDERAHCIQLDPKGHYAYIPHTRPNAIFQFQINPTSGKLTALDPAKLLRQQNTGPRHLWFDPKRPQAYGSDEQGTSITRYSFNPKSGLLQTKETLSCLPANGVEGKTSTSDIEVHPRGNVVYVATRNHNSIASFTINPDDGSLSPLQKIPSEEFTRSFNISANGSFLVAAGQRSDTLAVFSIQKDGKLHRTSSLECGEGPAWVQILNR